MVVFIKKNSCSILVRIWNDGLEIISEIGSVIKTIKSIRKVNEFPLYEMHNYANYDFDTFLCRGVSSDEDFYEFLNIKKNRIFQGSSYATDDMFACTCFSTKNNAGKVFFGRNFDWETHPVLLLNNNPEGCYKSISMVDLYYLGCNTGFKMFLPFNLKKLLKAPYLPFDGMNECGVAIGILRVPHAECLIDPDRVTINSITALRLILDKASSVDEAIELFKRYNIIFMKNIPLHYYIADASGRSVVIEFLEGKLNVIEQDFLWNVASNFILDCKYNEGEGIDRYYTANKILKRKKGDIDREEAMGILRGVKDNTVWSGVYDLEERELTICLGENYDEVKHFIL